MPQSAVLVVSTFFWVFFLLIVLKSWLNRRETKPALTKYFAKGPEIVNPKPGLIYLGVFLVHLIIFLMIVGDEIVFWLKNGAAQTSLLVLVLISGLITAGVVYFVEGLRKWT